MSALNWFLSFFGLKAVPVYAVIAAPLRVGEAYSGRDVKFKAKAEAIAAHPKDWTFHDKKGNAHRFKHK